jgi:enoyl-CoA hydratase
MTHREPRVLVERSGQAGAVALLRLNRPEKSNAVDQALIEELDSRLAALEADRGCRVIVLTGAGKSFCAGGDLDYFASLPPEEAAIPPATRMGLILDRLATGDRVAIAAVNGPAVGGGLETALACHLRLASESASFSMRHRDLGMSPGWGGGTRLLETIGVPAALWLLLTADTIDAGEALRLGLVHRVVPHRSLLEETLALATDIAARPRGSVAGFLRLAAAYRTEGAAAARRLEAALFAERWRSLEFQALLAERRQSRS